MQYNGPGGSGGVAAGTIPQVPVYNLTPANLRKWRAALGRVIAGTAFAKLLTIGDSTTLGIGASVAGFQNRDSWPARLADRINAQLVPANKGFVHSRSGNPLASTDTDNRVALGAGWNYASAFGFGSDSAYGGSAGAGALVFTPGINCDTFEVGFATGAAGTFSTISATIDGGSATNLVAGTGVSGVAKTNVVAAGGASAAHALSLPAPAANFWALWIDAYLSTLPSVRVANAAGGGETTANWAGNGALAALNAQATIKAYAPDLTIIMLGVNDANALNAYPAATVIANLAIIIAACQVSGDVILCSVIPSQLAAQSALEVTYQAAVSALAASMGIPFVDVFSRFNSWATANANGMMFDQAHPTAIGYADIADAMFGVLRMV